MLTGPEALSYDMVARIVSEVTGKEVVHRRLSEKELAQWFASQGMEPEYARVLAAMDTAIAGGLEDRTTNEVSQVTGRAANDFRAFTRAVKEVWTR